MIYANPVPRTGLGRVLRPLGDSVLSFSEKLEGDYAPVRFERNCAFSLIARGDGAGRGLSTGAFLFQLRSRFPDAYAAVGNDVAGPALNTPPVEASP